MHRWRRNQCLHAACTLGALALLSWTTEAAAYCQTTTCDPTSQACEKDGSGCVVEGIPISWPGGCFGYSLAEGEASPIPTQELAIVAQASFDAWLQAQCSDGGPGLRIAELNQVECAQAEFNPRGGNANTIFVRGETWPYESSALALTTVTYSTTTGEILDADIEVNAVHYTMTTTDEGVDYDLQSVLNHEVGHWLGLAHTLEASAVMYARHKRGSKSKRTLHADDEAGICAVYPPSSADSQCDPSPYGGFESTCGGTIRTTSQQPSASGCGISVPGRRPFGWGLALMGVALLLQRRRRSPSSR